MTSVTRQPANQLSLAQSLAYAAPVLPIFFLLGPLGVLQGIYAKYFGLPLSAMAAVLLIARLFDAVTDPAIGYWSDHYQRRTGSRKPFVLCGGVLFVLSSYFLYVPPNEVTVYYFLGWYMAYYLSWTLFEIPHIAWGTEIAANSQEKTRVFSFRTFGNLLGQLLFYAIPLLPFFTTDEFTPQTMKWSVLIAGILMVPLLYGCIFHTPKGVVTASPSSSGKEKDYLQIIFVSLWCNKPFLLFLVIYTFSSVGLGMWFTLIFIFVDAYLGLGDKYALVFILSLTTSTLTCFVWNKLTAHFGKKLIWCLGVVFSTLGVFSTSFLTAGESGYLSFLAVKICISLGFASFSILAPSVLGDIIDYGTWQSGVNRAGTYFSVYSLVSKASLALGAGLALAMAGWYGFDPAGSVHSAEAVFGLRLSIAYVPGMLLTASLVFIALFPLDAHWCSIIRRRLEARTAYTGLKKATQGRSTVEGATSNNPRVFISPDKNLDSLKT